MVFSFLGNGGGRITLPRFHHHFNNTTKKGGGLLVIIPSPGPGRRRSSLSSLSSVGFPSSSSITENENKNGSSFMCCCSPSSTFNLTSSSSSDEDDDDDDDGNYSDDDNFSTTLATTTNTAPLVRKRKRYRKRYPGESEGIVEEMRFVAMKLRNNNSTTNQNNNNNNVDGEEEEKGEEEEGDEEESSSSAAAAAEGEEGETWQPSIEGFLKYLVNSKLVFQTLERVVDESDNVAYTYFRKTGLERSEGLEKDLEWFRQQNLVIPEPSNPGVSYAEYLEELAEKSAPSFLCHFYNIYFAHISGGQVIAKQVSERLLEGRDLEFYRWEGDAPELLKDVRENLNKLGEHWTRDEKNKCLREAAKSFRYLGQIVRLIIL